MTTWRVWSVGCAFDTSIGGIGRLPGRSADGKHYQACGTWAKTKAAYRSLSHESVCPDPIRDAHANATVERAEGCRAVLVAQDTTCLDFTSRAATTGLGPLPHPSRQGILLHSAVALREDGVPLGIVHQKTWARDSETSGKRHERKQKATRDKESQR